MGRILRQYAEGLHGMHKRYLQLVVRPERRGLFQTACARVRSASVSQGLFKRSRALESMVSAVCSCCREKNVLDSLSVTTFTCMCNALSHEVDSHVFFYKCADRYTVWQQGSEPDERNEGKNNALHALTLWHGMCTVESISTASSFVRRSI